jgi:hypothetical protein
LGGVLPFGESQMINHHIVEHHIDLKLETNLVEIISDENGHVKAVLRIETINCELVGLTTGVSPNIDSLKFWNRIRKRNQSESISETSVQNILRDWRLC